jgi:hypothetical protein
MKNSVLLSLLIILLTAGSAYAVPVFQILDSTFHISGAVGYQSEGGLVEDKYDLTSYNPLNAMAEVVDPLARAQTAYSLAQYGYLYSSLEDENDDSGAFAVTEVWSDTTFTPLFDGSGQVLSFYHNCAYPYGNNVITVTDNTLGVEVFNAGWDLVSGIRTVSLDYSGWDMNHTYTLSMSLWGSTNAVGWQEYEMGTDLFEYAKVPEPSTIFFSAILMISLIICSRMSIRKSL